MGVVVACGRMELCSKEKVESVAWCAMRVLFVAWFVYGLRTSAQQQANYPSRDFQMTSPWPAAV